MVQLTLQMSDLPDAPLDAAARFLAQHLEPARELLKKGAGKRSAGAGVAEDIEALVFVFPAAGKEHHGWRLAAIQELAREAAPKRVNGVAGNDPQAIEEAVDWLASSAGITGQVLAVDGKLAETR